MFKKYYPVLIGILIVLITLFEYKGITHLYLFNDEWEQLGAVYRFGMFASLNDVPFVQLLLGKNRLLGSLLNNIFFLRFGDNVTPIAIFGLIFHCINAWLIYVITKRVTKNTFIGSMAALFFVSASVAHQALTWPAATVQTVSSITFLLLSLYFAFRYQQTSLWKYIGFVLVNLYISFLIKDNTIILLPVIVALPFLFGTRRLTIRNIPRYIWALVVGLFLLAVYKAAVYFRLSFSNFLSPNSMQGYLRWVVNIVYYPIVSVAHLFIPFPYMLRLAHGLGWYYSLLQKPPFNGVALEILSETVLSDFVSLFLSIVIIAVMYVSCRALREYKSISLFFVLFYILNFVPIALFLNERNTSYIESRYLYACVVPFSILVGISLESLKKWVSSNIHVSQRNSMLIVGSIFMFFVYKQMVVIERYVATAVNQSNQIRDTADLFMQMRPYLPNKPIIYLTSDSRYYVNAPVPFQLGPGYILMVKYYPTGVVPSEFLVGSKAHYYPFLYNYVDQGYRELGSNGFGYFSDKTKLLELYKSDMSLTTDQIVGFRYSGREKRLSDITNEIRQYIQDAAPRVRR